MKGMSGRALMDALVELVVALLIVPPLICCAFQMLAMVIGVVLPWLMLAVIALGAAACLGAGLAGRHRPHVEIQDDLPLRIPPVRRPPGIPDRHRERRDH